MMPACSHTGTPLHFHSSTTSGSACLMRSRTRASISPRQSSSSLILASISREGESPAFSSVAPLFVFFMVLLLSSWSLSPGRSHSFAGQLTGLLHPGGELSFVELIVLMDVEVAGVPALGLTGRDGTQRRSAEESHFDVFREAMDAEEPALAIDAVKRRVPFDRLAHAGNGARDERVEAVPDVAFPTRHGRDVGLHGSVALGLRDLRVAACEEGRLCDLAGPRLPCNLRRLPGHLA